MESNKFNSLKPLSKIKNTLNNKRYKKLNNNQNYSYYGFNRKQDYNEEFIKRESFNDISDNEIKMESVSTLIELKDIGEENFSDDFADQVEEDLLGIVDYETRLKRLMNKIKEIKKPRDNGLILGKDNNESNENDRLLIDNIKDQKFKNEILEIYKEFMDIINQKIKDDKKEALENLNSSKLEKRGPQYPIMNLIIHSSYILLDSLQSEIFPLTGVPVQEWMEWIVLGLIHPELSQLLEKYCGFFYNNGKIEIEIQDFIGVKPKYDWKSETNQALAISNIKEDKDLDSKAMSPKVYRVKLKNYKIVEQIIEIFLKEVIEDNIKITDEELENLEPLITNALTQEIYLQPEPDYLLLINFLSFQNTKYRLFNQNPWVVANEYIKNKKKRAKLVKSDDRKKYKNQTLENYSFKNLAIIEQYRNFKKMLDNEVFFGLDPENYDLIPTNTNFNLHKLYRTIKIASEKRKWYISLHVFLNSNGSIEILIRQGSVKNTSIDGLSCKFQLPNFLMLDNYIRSFLNFIKSQDKSMECVSDIVNSAAFPYNLQK